MLNLMIGLNGYTLCSGIICEELNGSDCIAVPFHADEQNPNSLMEIGYVTRKNTILSQMGERYIHYIKQYLKIEEQLRLHPRPECPIHSCPVIKSVT